MAKALNILFVASEVYPLSKEGGIADVTFSLPLALRDLGNDVRVMVPKYGSISERKNKIHEIKRLKDINIPMFDEEIPATIKSSSINNPRNKVQAYITTNFKYFDSRKGIYHDPKTWEEYPDNAERFIFFNRSVLETCMALGWYPDVIHCHDWHASLVPAMARTLFPKQFKKTKFVLTIHNFYRQGNFSASTAKKTMLSEETIANFMHKRQFNFLKGGLHYADYVTTVSQTYAKEVIEEKININGLLPSIKAHNGNFKGILNGIDTWIWNAERDDTIKAKYQGDLEEYKYHNKMALLHKFDLEYNPKTPLLAMVSRIDKQKGVELLIEAAEEIIKEDIQFVLLGQGDADLKEKLQAISDKYPDKFQVKFTIDEELAHLMEAGSDMYLIPSESEPCGLNFMYSLVYGSVPVVRISGGLNETVVPFNEETEEGNAIAYRDFTKDALLDAVKRARKLYDDKEKWYKLASNCMECNNSWAGKASQYDEIYRKLMKDV